MPKLLTVARPAAMEEPLAPDVAGVIRERLLDRLGEPPDLLRVQVKPLWGSFYRANVFVGKGPTARMAHSFFLDVDDGEIVSASPAIARLY
jgi:hypothetical protein